ncbi:hypothetical protein A0256_00140 [Mucilaginibacter sp. PAMC 26640]|nr:hypothetical protein A0256_00140 [Mucilaginibacter sp. PAMC 26640]
MKKNSITILLLIISTLTLAQNRTARITLEISSLKKSDSISIIIEKYGQLNTQLAKTEKEYRSKLAGSVAQFSIPVSDFPLRFQIRLDKKESDSVKYSPVIFKLQTSFYLLEGGDDFRITQKSDQLYFSGKGNEKLKLIDDLNEISLKYGLPKSYSDFNDVKSYLNQRETLFQEQQALIDVTKSLISKELSCLLKAEVTGNYLSRNNVLFSAAKRSEWLKDSLRSYRKLRRPVLDTNQINGHRTMLYTSNYPFGLLAEYQLDSVVLKKVPFNLLRCYNFFKSHFNGYLRERIITELLYENKRQEANIAGLCIDALSYFRNKEFREGLEDILKVRKDRNVIYNFSLADASGKKVPLSTFKGKVLFLDFWFTGCGSCRLMPPVIKNVMSTFAGKPVVFLSISIDKSKALWMKNANSGIYTTPGEIDLYTEGLGIDHPITRYFDITGAPTLILFDTEGKFVELPDPATCRRDNGVRLNEIIQKQLTL